jgi:hypothetical protein
MCKTLMFHQMTQLLAKKEKNPKTRLSPTLLVAFISTIQVTNAGYTSNLTMSFHLSVSKERD